ncbi:hypothetical protein [Nocardia sp. SSK8]|uniref:hypothetical protein n=1 Tax=Nocardia sp. SSK8 TaxID=3120154 RepID=UPI00300A3DA1
MTVAEWARRMGITPARRDDAAAPAPRLPASGTEPGDRADAPREPGPPAAG